MVGRLLRLAGSGGRGSSVAACGNRGGRGWGRLGTWATVGERGLA
jgi:hypothetical protein